jgi:LPXTG-motif cell wall-anchored protein
MLRRLIAVASLVLVAVAAPAAAQQYPPAVNSLVCSDTTPTPGQTISVEARTFAGGAEVSFTLAPDNAVVATATADAAGVVATGVTIPAGTTPGEHTLTASGAAPDGSTLKVTCALTVVGADEADGDAVPSGALPRTGDDSSLPLAKLGLALAAIGGVITAVAAKRRKAAAVTG